MQVLDARAGIDLRAIEEHAHEHGTDEESVSDPHVWTSPLLVGQPVTDDDLRRMAARSE